MSVQPGPTFKRYAANGIAPTYAIPFLLLDAADLQITLNGVLVTSGFTLAGIGNPTSSCTFSVPPTGDLLFLQVLPFQRLTDYQINGDFLAQTVNPDFDRLWLACKQLFRDSGRALTVNELEPEGIPPLPVKATRALKMLAFDADGNPEPSNLTMEQIEQQPALALESVALAVAAKNAAQGSANAAHASELAAAASATDALLSEQAAATYASDPWALQPIGVPIGLLFDIPATIPPTNKSYRYIKLTASDAYNTGVLTGQAVSGSAPLVIATATISLAGSPLDGLTVNLINTERRSLKAGNATTVEQDALQDHTHRTSFGEMYFFATAGSQSALTGNIINGTGGTATALAGTGLVSATARTATETRVKNIGVTYYMRIK